MVGGVQPCWLLTAGCGAPCTPPPWESTHPCMHPPLLHDRPALPPLQDTLFVDNESVQGGALFTDSPLSLTITGCEFTGCAGTVGGL